MLLAGAVLRKLGVITASSDHNYSRSSRDPIAENLRLWMMMNPKTIIVATRSACLSRHVTQRAKFLYWCSNRHCSVELNRPMRSAYGIHAGTHTFSRDGVIGGAELNTAVSISAPAQKFCSLDSLYYRSLVYS